MTEFNPNNPDTVGLEWFPARQRALALSPSTHYGLMLPSTATESVTGIGAYVVGSGRSAVDVYDLANPFVDAQKKISFLPENNFSNADAWSKKSGSTFLAYSSNAFTYVNDPIPASVGVSTPYFSVDTALVYAGINPSLVAQILFRAGHASIFDGDDGTTLASTALVGKRIQRVFVVVIVANVNDAGTVRFDGYLNIGGSRFSSDTGPVVVPAGQSYTRYRFGFDKNPATGQPWTYADAVKLTNNVDDAFGVGVITKPRLGNFGVFALNLEFDVVPERRVATGIADVPARDWSSFLLLDPADGTTQPWAKVNGHHYIIAFRQVLGSPSLPIIDPGVIVGHTADPPPAGMLGAGFQTAFGAPTQQPVNDIWVPGFALAITGGSGLGADAQPYVQPSPMAVAAGMGANRQTLAPHASASYGIITAILAFSTGVPTAPLVITIRRSSDNVQIGGSVTVQPSEVLHDGLWHAITKLMTSSAALASGTGYYLNFASSSAIPWYVLGCFTGPFEDASLPPTFGGGIAASLSIPGAATWDGYATTTLDILANVKSVPAPPTGLGATVGTKVLTVEPPGGPSHINYAALNWNNTALGVKFGSYELQRLDGSTWNTIARITDETKSFFNDIECLRGVAQQYRVRVVRIDGAPSDWST